MLSLTEHGLLGPPPTLSNSDCISTETIKAALQNHALLHSYAINTDCSTPVKAAWTCSKSGKYRVNKNMPDVLKNKRRKNTSTMKTGCKFRVSATRQGTMPQIVKIVSNNHNHGLVKALSALPQHRIAAISEKERSLVNSIYLNSHSPKQILSTLELSGLASHLIVKDVYNLLYKLQLDKLASLTLIKQLLKVTKGYKRLLIFLLTNLYKNLKRWASLFKNTVIQ